MDRALCIHGHFYQPPREDPWLGRILPEGSAAPATHWNERICRESYAPLARARRQDSGRIAELVNCYALMSFNAGPTLMSWMARSAPDTYERLLEADRDSLARLGHGNALAQIYHHVIMPLASARDKKLEVAWAVDDFTARFKRAPEGMWLSETAVDTPTLEELADAGIRFTILAPSQAAAVSDNGRDWRGVDAGSLDIRQPYEVHLPSGRTIAVFFYHGPLSQAVAFDRLLTDGENFFRRLSEAAGPGLLSLATDGETYGHHFKFGEMALAYVLDQVRSGRDGLTLTNYAAYLAANPPRKQVRIHEASAWSCAHGVERWRSDCGCTAGDHAGQYNQRWRAPLRKALDLLKTRLDAHYEATAAPLFNDAEQALVAYGGVLAGTTTKETFEHAHMVPKASPAQRGTAWKLLSMQSWGLASFASCAWFFDEISRLEPVNAMTFALRAAELARATGMADPEPDVTAILAEAVSNEPDMGSGRDIWERLARPRRETPRTLITQALLTLSLEERLPSGGNEALAAWPGVDVTIRLDDPAGRTVSGTASVRYRLETASDDYVLTFTPAETPDSFQGCATIQPAAGGAEEGFCFTSAGLPINKRQALADTFTRRAEAVFFSNNLAQAAIARNLVTERQEAQNTINLAPLLLPLWPGLIWHEVFELPLPPKRRELLHLFLKHTGQDSPVKAALEARIAAEAARLIGRPDPDWQLLARLVRHVADLDLHPDWWAAQNALWERRPFAGSARELAGALGFAV